MICNLVFVAAQVSNNDKVLGFLFFQNNHSYSNLNQKFDYEFRMQGLTVSLPSELT